MPALNKKAFFDHLPDETETRSAEHLRQIIASGIREGEPTRLSLAVEGGEPRTVTLAPALAEALLDMLRLVSGGRGFAMVPIGAELTTQQAADLLHVSRPFLVKLLEEGEIPFIRTGRHRRIRANDLFAYRDKRDKARSDALNELARMDVEDGLI